MSIYDKASLVLIPSGTKTSKVYSQVPTNGDGDFTFSRSTAATRVNADGNIEKETNNQLLHSNSFVTSWTGNNSGITGGQLGYDGTYNASKHNATGGYSYRAQFGTYTGVCTFSIYAKAGTAPFIRLYTSSSPSVYTNFDLVNGTIQPSGAIDSKMVDVGNGWYRCSMTFNASNNNLIYFYCAGANGDVGITTTGDNIYVQHAQVEQGLVARDYIETTTAAVEGGITDNVPRLDYTDSSCPALLLEPQRTNLVIHSEYTDGANWSNEGSIGDEENTSETTSPEGYYNAVKLVSNNATSEQWLQASVNVTSTGYYTASCFVKKSDYDFFYIRFTGANSVWGAGGAWFNINTGSVATIQSGVTADIVDYGNGWYRVSATKEAVNTGIGAIRFQLVSSDNSTIVAGDGSKGTYGYGFQLEQGSYATSYIPTYGSAVTRNVELNTQSSGAIGNPTSWSLFFECARTELQSTQDAITLEDSTGSVEQIRLHFDSPASSVRFRDARNSYTNIGSSLSVTKDTFFKGCLTSDGTTLKAYWNGALSGSRAVVNQHDVDRVFMFSKGFKTKQLLVFPTALTDQEAIDLTTL